MLDQIQHGASVVKLYKKIDDVTDAVFKSGKYFGTLGECRLFQDITSAIRERLSLSVMRYALTGMKVGLFRTFIYLFILK